MFENCIELLQGRGGVLAGGRNLIGRQVLPISGIHLYRALKLPEPVSGELVDWDEAEQKLPGPGY